MKNLNVAWSLEQTLTQSLSTKSNVSLRGRTKDRTSDVKTILPNLTIFLGGCLVGFKSAFNDPSAFIGKTILRVSHLEVLTIEGIQSLNERTNVSFRVKDTLTFNGSLEAEVKVNEQREDFRATLKEREVASSLYKFIHETKELFKVCGVNLIDGIQGSI
jgi:hypothetical protein